MKRDPRIELLALMGLYLTGVYSGYILFTALTYSGI